MMAVRLLCQQMNYNQKVLELHPQQSKLLDSLCFELAVNIPDQNSLSLLEIIEMRRSSQINDEELKQLYVDWLQSKNIFDIFTAKQVRTFAKGELLSSDSLSRHIEINTVLSTLQLLNTLYNEMYLSKRRNEAAHKQLQQIQDLFQFLDANGNIHLGLSELLFLATAIFIVEGQAVPQNYEQFKSLFKRKNRQLCEVEGMVCLRSFKNYFLAKGGSYAKQIHEQLKQISKWLKKGQLKARHQTFLPDIFGEALSKYRNSMRFNGVFEAKKKRFEIYQRIFTQNAEVFYFNGKDQNYLTQSWFYKKYSESYIKSLQIQSGVLNQFAEIVHSKINQYLSTIGKISALMHKQKSQNGFTSNINSQTASLHLQQTSSAFKIINQNQKRANNATSQISNKTLGSKIQNNTSFKQRTPTKNNKGSETRRFNVTPNHRNSGLSPFINKQFASTEKQAQKNKTNLTPSKSSHSGYSLYMAQSTQVYRNSKKQGLEKDSFYQKLFFFRNKRVESFDIVMKRLRGK